MHEALPLARMASEMVSTAHCAQAALVLARGAYVPGWQFAQVAFVVAPDAVEYVPELHSVHAALVVAATLAE